MNAVACKVPETIELLVTLNSVSRNGLPLHRFSNVRHWLNIYIDYVSTTWLDVPNLVARIGTRGDMGSQLTQTYPALWK